MYGCWLNVLSITAGIPAHWCSHEHDTMINKNRIIMSEEHHVLYTHPQLEPECLDNKNQRHTCKVCIQELIWTQFVVKAVCACRCFAFGFAILPSCMLKVWHFKDETKHFTANIVWGCTFELIFRKLHPTIYNKSKCCGLQNIIQNKILWVCRCFWLLLRKSYVCECVYVFEVHAFFITLYPTHSFVQDLFKLLIP